MAVQGARQRIHDAVLSWPGVSANPHRFGGMEYRLGKRELGHVHGDHLVDIPFPKKVRDELVAAGRAEPHHVLPRSGWVSFYLNEPADVERAIALLRQSFELAEKQSLRKRQPSEVNPKKKETPMNVKAVPAGHRTVSPYLAIKDAVKALEFYKKAFGAVETYKLVMPDGRLGHAEIRLGDSVIMLADEFPEFGGKSPQTLGGSPVCIHLYVDDVDAFFKQALAAGAKERRAVMDQFYGDRSGQLEDPFGHLWWVATHTEDVPPEELQKRA